MEVEELASSISLTILSISGSGTCRNWNREVMRGRNLPRRCCPVSVFGASRGPNVENSSRITGTPHRFAGSLFQQVVIMSHTLRRNHRFAS